MPTLPQSNYSAVNQPEKDRCQSPPYAIKPILPYLNRNIPIWESACGDKYMVDALQSHGFRVIASDIIYGQDFFAYANPIPTMLYTHVTNPPYSLKYRWLDRCFQHNRPFALLVPDRTIFAAKYFAMLRKYNISIESMEIIVPTPRINFIMPFLGQDGIGAHFTTIWLTHGLRIGRQFSEYRLIDRDGWK